jgi:hypothetical protein
MANPQVKAALAKDSTTSITVSSLGNDLMEVIVESRGPIIIAQVDTRNKAIVLKEISYVIILGSRYEPQEQLTSPEREKVLALASIDRDFRTLMAKGAVVVKTNAVECLIATRHFDTSQNSETREKWAMVQLDWQQDHWYFLVDSQNGRVINRNPAVVP